MRRHAAIVAIVMFALPLGCQSSSRDLLTRPYDAGVDAPADAEDEPFPDAGEVDPTLGGPCVDDAQCDDQIACTYDLCDRILARCRNTPDDTVCSDGVYCNGKERCVLRHGCAPGPVVTCQDDDSCTIDKCVEVTQSCTHSPRDADGDGDPDDHCVPAHDCDDIDPLVASTAGEVCANGKDDDCDGQVDEQPCSSPANDVCATALSITAPGTVLLSTLAAKKDYATSCSVTTPSASRDIVVAITIPGLSTDPPVDLQVWATASSEVAVALETTCGQSGTEIACNATPKATTARALARSVSRGTYFAVVTTQGESAVDLSVDFLPPTTRPANETCASPLAVALDTPFSVSIVDAAKDLVSGCTSATGELTYSFTLAQPSDVRIFASTVAGQGAAVVSLRGPTCTDELRCRVGSAPPLFARSLAAGTHVFSVAATSSLDASLIVQTSPPTAPPANQTCATAPPALVNGTFAVDLGQQEDAIQNGCLPGGPNAAYDLTLTAASDVLVVARFPPTENGAVSLDGPGCTPSDVLACAVDATPVRISKRNVPAGDYRVVVADEHGQTATLTVLVRPTVAPILVTDADVCGNAVPIPPAGGFIEGDTTGRTANYNAGCDSPGVPVGGAPDQMLLLDMPQPGRVVLDMNGSVYTTVLDVRQGPSCPGTEVLNACYVGFTGPRSFLDLPLGAGSYWIQIDGFNGDKGPWDLDVRVLPP